MKVLTAYNQDVQKFLIGRCTTKKKDNILDAIEKTVFEAGKSFSKLFPPSTKRKQVMDKILFLLSGSGICKVSAKTLAETIGCSIRTVSDAVKNLKETGEVLVGGLADGENKYVFVYKQHQNFQQILKEVFFIDELPVEEIQDHVEKEEIAEPIAEQVAELSNTETFDTVSTNTEKASSNYNNFFKSFNSLKQEKNNYIESITDEIESELKEASSDKKKELERINTYYVNEYQEMLYHTIKAGEYHPAIKENASILGLRVGSNATRNMFTCALQSVIKIHKFLLSGGTISDSVPALFSRIYKDKVKTICSDKKRNTGKSEVSEVYSRKLICYNWLEEDRSDVITPEAPIKPFFYQLEEISATNEELDEMGIF
jgi:Mn-dependent DtxR family transcriptional regulator